MGMSATRLSVLVVALMLITACSTTRPAPALPRASPPAPRRGLPRGEPRGAPRVHGGPTPAPAQVRPAHVRRWLSILRPVRPPDPEGLRLRRDALRLFGLYRGRQRAFLARSE